MTNNAMTPEVYFVPGFICIMGRSTAEDPNDFFSLLVTELSKYIGKGNPLHISWSLEYYNTVSIGYLRRIFRLLVRISDTCSVRVSWNYYTDDENMKELGEFWEEQMPELDIEMLPHDPPAKVREIF